MKSLLRSFLLVTLIPTTALQAKTETWTRKDGKTAQLQLVNVAGEGDQLVGKFKLANGKDFEMKVTELAEADAQRLIAAAKLVAEGGSLLPPKSVYDAFFKDGLVKLEGQQLKPFDLEENPGKYFVFYHTASWCGPCQQFMPVLKAFDEKYKDTRAFQIILISHDQSSSDMTAYAKAKSIPWPHVKYSRIKDFTKEFPHPGTAIPSLIVTDMGGKILYTPYKDGKYYGGELPLRLLEQNLSAKKAGEQPAK